MISFKERTQGRVVGGGQGGGDREAIGGTCAGAAGAGPPFKETGRAKHDAASVLQLRKAATTYEIQQLAKTYVMCFKFALNLDAVSRVLDEKCSEEKFGKCRP